MKLIDKSSLVAEIERMKNIQLSIFSKGETQEDCYDSLTCISVYNEILSFLDNLEVKEVDLDFQTFAKEMSDSVFTLPANVTQNTEEDPLNWEYAIAKHFFELGVAVSNKAQKGE